MVAYFFNLVLREIDARYATGVARYVHSFIDGLIYGLSTIGALTSAEAENLSKINQERLEAALEKEEQAR